MRVTPETLSKALLAGPRPKTPTTIRTITTTLLQQYARHTGETNAEDLGDLSWLTEASLTAPNKAPRLRPWPGGGGAGAVLEASTRSRMLQNFRSALDALDRSCPPGLHVELRRGWRAAYDDFGRLFEGLQREQARHILSREPSIRQQRNWVPWPDVQAKVDAMVTSIELGDTPRARRELRRALMVALYVYLPPLRLDLHCLRFVDAGRDPEELAAELRRLACPNYIEVAEDGGMVMVINAYKNDGRARAPSFEPERGDFVLDHEKTVRLELSSDPVLEQFGFKPARLCEMLTDYRRMNLDAGLFLNASQHAPRVVFA